MKFTLKTYKFLKIKDRFKQNNFFCICNTKTAKNNIQTTQKLKKLNLKSYKLYKTLTQQIFENSIYENQKFLMNGLVMIVIPQTNLTLNTLVQLNKIATTIGIKINNKIYSTNQFNSLIKFKYNEESANLLKTMKICLKPLKIITYNRQFSK